MMSSAGESTGRRGWSTQILSLPRPASAVLQCMSSHTDYEQVTDCCPHRWHAVSSMLSPWRLSSFPYLIVQHCTRGGQISRRGRAESRRKSAMHTIITTSRLRCGIGIYISLLSGTAQTGLRTEINVLHIMCSVQCGRKPHSMTACPACAAASAWHCQSSKAACLSTVASALFSSAYDKAPLRPLNTAAFCAARHACCLVWQQQQPLQQAAARLCQHRPAACCSSVSSCALCYGSSLMHMLGFGGLVGRSSASFCRLADCCPLRQSCCTRRLQPLRLACCTAALPQNPRSPL